MNKDGVLALRLVDVSGKPLRERVDILLSNRRLEHRRAVKAQSTAKIVRIGDLHSGPNGLYHVFIDPPSYLPISRFVNVGPDGKKVDSMTFPVDSQKIVRVKFPTYEELSAELRSLLERSSQVVGFQGQTGAQLYDALDDIRKAGMLNISAKATAVTFNSRGHVLSYFQELSEIRGDRFFVNVNKDLREETKNSIDSGTFHPAGQALHHPPEGFSNAGSFKTPDHYGNLQLTFWAKEGEWRVDVDIDDANGIEHLFQVLRNHLTGRPTHPYNIHQILVAHQKLDPGYTFEV